MKNDKRTLSAVRGRRLSLSQKVRGGKRLEAEVVCGTLAISELTHRSQSRDERSLCLEYEVSMPFTASGPKV